jgi:RecA-family ATPase
MNQVNKVRGFMNQFFMLTDKHNCLVIFLHHTGKHTEEYPPNKSHLLGSQGIEGKARQVIELRRDPYDSQFRHLCIVKGNYLKDDMKTHSFKMLFVDQQFEMTEDRIDFDDLVSNRDEKKQLKEQRLNRVAELYSPDVSYQEIADRMTGEGLRISKSTVGNDVLEARRRGIIE